MTTRINMRGDQFVTVRALLMVVLSLLGGMGCAQQYVYNAASLPGEFEAPHIANAQAIDLSKFSGPPANHERIEHGDVLEVSIAAGLNSDSITTFPVRVADDGSVLIPELGPISLAGLDLAGGEQAIAAACMHRGLYRRPQITVTMKQQRVNRITVVGAVEEPGIHEIPRKSSYLLGAIVAAGGLADDAGTKVELRRAAAPRAMAGGRAPMGVQLASNTVDASGGAMELVCLNLAEAVNRGGGGEYLPDGSVVQIEKRNPAPIQVIGLVNKPGQFDFPVNHDLRLFGAIAMAEGLTYQIAEKASVIRHMPGQEEPVVIHASLTRAKGDSKENVRLAPGDIVVVEQTPATVLLDALKVARFGIGASLPMF